MLIIAIDTTGLLNKRPGWNPRVVAVGMAHVQDRRIVASDATLVRQPPTHVHHEFARGAWRANRLRPDEVVAATMADVEVAAAVRSQLDAADGRWTAFNARFAEGFLCESPWFLPPAAECLMQKAAEAVPHVSAGPDGVSRVVGRKELHIKMTDAFAWVAGLGARVAEGQGIEDRKTWGVGAEPTHDKVVRLARLYVALEQFGDDLPF